MNAFCVCCLFQPFQNIYLYTFARLENVILPPFLRLADCFIDPTKLEKQQQTTQSAKTNHQKQTSFNSNDSSKNHTET